jgi:hypothetical protein
MANANTTTKTATATATAGLEAYADKLATWPVEVAGPKPAAANFKAAHALGARVGTKVALALAMYMRPKGATQGQVFNVVGSPQLNKMRAAIAAGHAKRVDMPRDGNGHMVYKLALPEKAASKATGKRKAAGKGKAPAKPAPATTQPATAENATA